MRIGEKLMPADLQKKGGVPHPRRHDPRRVGLGKGGKIRRDESRFTGFAESRVCNKLPGLQAQLPPGHIAPAWDVIPVEIAKLLSHFAYRPRADFFRIQSG